MKRGQSSQYVVTNLQAISGPFIGWQDQSVEALAKIRTTIMICKFYITGAAKATHKSSHNIREFPQPALSPSCQAWSSGFLRGINLGEWLVRFFLQIAQKNFEYPFVPFWWEICINTHESSFLSVNMGRLDNFPSVDIKGPCKYFP